MPVVTADDFAAACRFLGTTRVSAIVLDIETASDWWQCALIMAGDVRRNAPVVMLTGWRAPDGRFRRRAFELGCSAFVAKPCPVERLLQTVTRVRSGERNLDVPPA